MITTTQINPLPLLSGETTGEAHKKLSRQGELNLLVALNKLLTAYDALQKAVAKVNSDFAANGVVTIIDDNKALLNADQENMHTFSLTHQGDKDKDGNNVYGSEMMALENGYATDKAACQRKTDQATVITTLLSDSVNALSTSTSSIASQTQTAMDLTGSLLNIVLSLVA